MKFRSSVFLPLCLVLALPFVMLTGCSHSSNNTTTPASNPVPTVTSLSPSTALIGAAPQTVTITGTNFIASSTVTYNGSAATATYVSATQLTIPLTAANQAAAGTFPVVVTNPTPGGGSSTAVNFAVNNPPPTVSAISPSTLVAGSPAQTLTVIGTNFLATSTVTFNGTTVAGTVVSPTQLTIPLTAANLTTAGSFPVVVTNGTPGGGSSAAVSLTVTNPVPAITSISPSAVSTGAAAQTLTVTGTNFLASSTVTLAGIAATATVASSTSLTIPLTAANLAKAGSYPVVVTNPAPGGGSSAAVALVVGGTTVSGTVYKGASVGSTVTVYALNSDGTNGSSYGSGTTDSKGNFTLTLTSIPTGPVRVVATGGTYLSEWDGSTLTGTSSVSAIVDAITVNVTGLALTPYSEFISSYTAGLLSSKKATAEPAAHTTASALVGGCIGVSLTSPPEMITPVFDKGSITSSPDAFKLGLYIGALATEGHTMVPTSPDDLIAALSLDFSDGVFDGKAFGTPVPLPNGVSSMVRMKFAAKYVPDATTTPVLPITAGTTDFLSALGTYTTSGAAIKAAGIAPADVAPDETSITGSLSGCPATPVSVGLSASSSGAVTTYSIGGKQYLIVAGRQQGVVIIDITNPTLASPPINAWPIISSSTFSGQSVGGVVVVTGLAGHPQVLAYAYGSKTLAVLNLNTLVSGNPVTDNPVDVSTTLSLAATSPVYFSGGNAYIAGGIPDTLRGGVWLDTADGYGLLSLSALAVTPAPTSVSLSPLYKVEDKSDIVAENVGGDINNNQLLGGNYGGVQLVELTKAKSYYLSAANLGKFSPNVTFIDGDSIDTALRVGIMTGEDNTSIALMNLATVTETDASPTAPGTLNTLTPATGGVVQVKLGSSGGFYGSGPIISGSAVDKTTHLALFMAGYSNDLVVGQVQDPAAATAAGTPWTGLSDWSYYTINNSPELASYYYATDPHSVGVIINQTTGTPFGYLQDGYHSGIVQIDMAGFLALKRAGTAGDPAHQPGVDPGAATTTLPGGLTGIALREFTWTDPTKGLFAEPVKPSVNQPHFMFEGVAK
jgi:hypothetical protein